MSNEFEKLQEAIGRLATAFIDVCVALANTINRLAAATHDGAQIAKFARTCPNRRVAHLALHGKKRRVRKKNIKRLEEYAVVYGDGMFLFDNKCVKVPRYDIYDIKIIGNIHDNPELLKGGAP